MPQFWRRYVDDVLEIIHKDGTQKLTDHLNTVNRQHQVYAWRGRPGAYSVSRHPHRKADGSVKLLVYRKKTHTDQYLDFNSQHPLHQKLGVVRTIWRQVKWSMKFLVRVATKRMLVKLVVSWEWGLKNTKKTLKKLLRKSSPEPWESRQLRKAVENICDQDLSPRGRKLKLWVYFIGFVQHNFYQFDQQSYNNAYFIRLFMYFLFLCFVTLGKGAL